MLLELGKAVSFAACILSLYAVLMGGFFEPQTTWQQRLLLGLTRLAVSASISFAAGVLFRFPVRTNSDRGISIWKTLPVQLYLWGAAMLTVLFGLAWYLRCGGVNSFDLHADCF
jgi:hypothetical protein